MHFKDVARGEAWMTPEEHRCIRRFVTALKDLFLKHGVEETPLLVLRVSDVAVHYLLVRRIEAGLTPDKDSDDTAVTALSGTLSDQIGKARERLRKSIRELEDACARSGRPIDVGIADQVLPLVRNTSDLLHGTTLPTPKETVPSERQ